MFAPGAPLARASPRARFAPKKPRHTVPAADARWRACTRRFLALQNPRERPRRPTRPRLRRPVDARILARATRAARPALRRRARRPRRLRDPPRPAPAGHLVGDRAPQERTRSGPGGQALRSYGRRLRRDLRRLHPLGHHQQTQDPPADVPRARPRREEARRPHRAHRRPVRQAAQQPHRDPHDPRGVRNPAQLLRRPHQPRRLQRRRPQARPLAPGGRVSARGADAELHPLPRRRRLRRRPPPGILGPFLLLARRPHTGTTPEVRQMRDDSPTPSASWRRWARAAS